MKRIVFSVVFILLLGLSMLKPYYPVLDYLIRYDYISTVLCVNKDKPKMHCNGKCHLSKEMSRATTDEQSTPFPLINFELKAFTPSEIYNHLQIKSSQKIKTAFVYKRTYSFSYSNSIFHPPVA